MVSERQALSAWQDSLQEEIGVDEAATIVDRVGGVATQQALDLQSHQFDRKLDRQSEEFDRKLDRQSEEFDRKLESLGNRLTAAWRRDLLLIAVPQFIALTAILLGIGS
jgi:chaperonin cofactor prefoldin